MRNEKKIAWQGKELERLRDDARELRAENRSLEGEIKRLERAPGENGCAMKEEWAERIRMCEIAIALLEEEENE